MKRLKDLLTEVNKIDAYSIDIKFRDWVDDIVYERPNQSPSFMKFIDGNKKTDKVVISFTDEVKDGRTPRFNQRDILKLKNKKFEIDNLSITIDDIKFLNVTTQESDSSYSIYYRYQYELKLDKN